MSVVYEQYASARQGNHRLTAVDWSEAWPEGQYFGAQSGHFCQSERCLWILLKIWRNSKMQTWILCWWNLKRLCLHSIQLVKGRWSSNCCYERTGVPGQKTWCFCSHQAPRNKRRLKATCIKQCVRLRIQQRDNRGITSLNFRSLWRNFLCYDSEERPRWLTVKLWLRLLQRGSVSLVSCPIPE